ncbi:MAG: hypothetical protein OXH73_21970 [Caldilineaceae bacterium]|nr:hypothetical protein [Caldilineaceae bacterium]
MKSLPRRNRKTGIAGTILLALLLTAALLPAAALATGPPPAEDDGGTSNTNQQTPLPNGGGGSQQQTPLPNGGGGSQQQTPLPNGGGGSQQQTPLPNGGGGSQQQTPLPNGGGGSQQQTPVAHPDAPSTPSSDCVVAHAATPAQLCPVADGLQYYFIGADGSTSIGPFISPFTDLASLYTAGDVLLYAGINPLTSKSVQIHYLTSSYTIRVSTYYPDTQYDTDKPYTFTVDGSHSVSHIAW